MDELETKLTRSDLVNTLSATRTQATNVIILLAAIVTIPIVIAEQMKDSLTYVWIALLLAFGILGTHILLLFRAVPSTSVLHASENELVKMISDCEAINKYALMWGFVSFVISVPLILLVNQFATASHFRFPESHSYLFVMLGIAVIEAMSIILVNTIIRSRKKKRRKQP